MGGVAHYPPMACCYLCMAPMAPATSMHVRFLIMLPLAMLASGAWAQPTNPAMNRTDAQGRKQGPWVRTWAGSKQARYEGQFKDDKPVGSFVYYSTDGKMESRVDHYPGSNAAHGRHYHPNGKLMAEGRYLGQDKDSTWNYFDTAGGLRSTEHWKAGKLHGAMTTYFPDGNVAENRQFANGVAEGKAEQFHPNGKPRYQANYVKGEPQGQETYFFPTGNKEIQGKYVNGNRDGAWQYFNDDGTVRMQFLYAQGKLVKQKYENGTFTEYWADERPKSEMTYKNGKLEGPFTEWYANGTWTTEPTKMGPTGEQRADVNRVLKGQTKKREGTYKNDVLEGPVKDYDEQGKLLGTVVYQGGEPSTDRTRP